jgi:antimicrobial peptide system SdpB family protein
MSKLSRNFRHAACGPWSPALGVARTILASATLLTLLLNDPDHLFRPLGLATADVAKDGVVRFSLFSVVPLEAARWIGVVILAVTATGWRPRLTALLHWWVAVSFAASAVVIEGGDQVCALLSLLLLPVCLLDSRTWHWQHVPCASEETIRAFAARSALFMTRLQVAVIYLVAAIGKFGVTEWDDGTALYYWFSHPVFGVDGWRAALAAPVITTWLVVPLTWSVLALELLLGMALVGSPRLRRILFPAGIVFHLGIIVVHGLVSFGLAMIAALVLFLRTPIACEHEGVRENVAPLPSFSDREEMVA